jgi:phosphatidylglycerophosphate synthase
MLAKLRPLYNKVVMPLGIISVRLGLKPDYWTFFSLVLAFISGYFLYKGSFWLGLILSIFMYAADMLDGATARAGNTSNKFGTVFDHVVDRYAEMVIIGSLLLGGWISPFVTLFCVSGIVMASYVRAKAESSGGLSDCTVGIAGRAEKLILTYGGIGLLGLGWPVPAEICFILVGLISHITVIQRLLYTRRMIFKQIDSNS